MTYRSSKKKKSQDRDGLESGRDGVGLELDWKDSGRAVVKRRGFVAWRRGSRNEDGGGPLVCAV